MKKLILISILILFAAFSFNGAKAQTGNALDFSGIDDPATAQYLNIPLMPDLSNFTVEFDLKINGGNQPFDRFFSSRNSGFELATDGSGNIKLWSYDLGVGSWTNFGYQMPLDTWQHVAFVYDGSRVMIYVDGVYTSEISASGNLLASEWFIARKQFDDPLYDLGENASVVIDNFRAWDIAVSDANILANYQNCLVGSEPNLTILYDFDEGSGSTVYDKASYGGLHNGTTTNNPSRVTGVSCLSIPLANALNFDGNNDQVTIPANAAFDFTTGTIECWIKPEAYGDQKSFISMRTGVNATRWSLHVSEGANTIGLWNGVIYNTIGVNIEPNKWYHLALVITTSNVQVYVDGVLSGTIPTGMNSGRTGLPLVIGSPNDPPYTTEYFFGSMDEVRVWNVARSSTDIAANMNSYITSGDAQWSNMVAYYRFDQGIAGADNTALVNEAVDYSGNCNKGALTNMALTGALSNWVFPGNAEAPVLTTNTASSIGSATATLNGNILSIGETNVTNRGFQYSTGACMTSPTTVSETGTYSAGSYSLNATGLNPSTTYYYRSYSTNSKGTSYGETQSFTTLAAYTITYNGNVNTGGTAPGNQTKTHGVDITLATNSGSLVKTGHTFTGWNTATDGSGMDYAAGGTYSGNAALTLYAKWTADTYTVTYNDNTSTGGTAPGNQTKTYGVDLTLATNSGSLVKTGHTFAGWNTAADGSGTDYAAGGTYSGNAALTLYAKWTADTYTVTYNDNTSTGGTSPGNQTKTYGVDLTLATNSGSLVKTGHTFAGWNTAADGTGTDYTAGGTYSGNAALTLFAKWTVDTYTVTYNDNTSTGGTAPGNQTKTYGVDLTLATNSGSLVKTGHSFAGWNTAADGTGTDYAVGAIYSGNAALTLYAKWTADTYTVIYNDNTSTGGTAPGNQTKTYGVDLTLANNSGSLVKTGHSFAGWNTAADGTGTDYTAGGTYSGNAALTLFAKWTADTYTVTYDANTATGGTAPVNQTKTYGVDLTLANNSGSLVKTGHSFAGWNTAADGSGTDYAAGAIYTGNAALTLYTKWTAETYTVTYNANTATGGTVPVNQTKTYGVDLTLANNSGSLVKTGHSFAGWNTAANGSGTDYAAGGTYTGNAALTLYAKWTADTYTVTYNGNGNTGGTTPIDANSPYAYATSVTVLGVGSMVKGCYNFIGWNTASDGSGASYSASTTFSIPANNITLYAQWQPDNQSWQNVGNAGFSAGDSPYTSLAIDNNGTPYVAYRDNANSSKASVMKFDGNNWVNVGNPGFSAGAAEYISHAIDNNGIPYVAYRDNANSNKATVMKFDGSNWVNVGSAGFSSGEVYYISLAISNGTPYLTYRDDGNSSKASVMKFDGSNWVYVGNAGFTVSGAGSNSLAIYNGSPYVAYADVANSYKATVMKFDGSNWVNVGNAGFSAGQVYSNSLSIDNNGTPYLAFRDYSNSQKASVMKFDGTNWVVVGSPGFSAGIAEFISQAIDNNGIPYVAYKDNSNSYKATVMKFDGTNWLNVGIAGFSAGSTNYNSFAINNSGKLFVAYNDGANSNKVTVMNFSATKYSVTYSGNGHNGGTVPVDNNSPYEACETVTVLSAGDLVKTGHTFNGWNTAADGSGTDYASSATFTMSASNITLYAKWTPDTYTVTYNANTATGGTAPGNQTKTYGVDLTLATNSGSLVKTGHTFAGWNTATDGSGTDYAAGGTYSGNAAITLYAKWTADTYTVTYNANTATAGTVPVNQTKTYGVDLTLANNSGSLVKTGYTFAGWNSAADGSGTDYAAGATYTGNAALTLFAKWTVETYTVTYNANTATGGTAPGNQTKTFGVDLTLATNSGSLVKTGHTFAGWNTATDGSGTDYAAGATYSGNAAITLYAKWTADTYTVTYNGNTATSGTAPANQTKIHGVDLTLATNSGSLVKTGHTFAGWNTALDGSGTNYAVGATYTGNAALTLYAKWTPVTIPPSVRLSSQPGCSGDQINLSYTVLAGSPTEYRIVFGQAAKDQGFTDISYTALPSSNATDIINFGVPANANYGDYIAEIQMRDAVGTQGLLQSFSFTVNLGANYIVAKFNDVVLCDNSSNSFVSYQWYKDGVMITGATNQYYNDLNGLNGNYSVTVVTTNGQTLHSCEKYFNTPVKKTAELVVYPNPARASEKFAVKINNLTQDELQGSVMNIYNSRGVIMYSTKEVKQQNDIRLPSNGDYYGVLITRDGIKLSYKVIVIN